MAMAMDRGIRPHTSPISPIRPVLTRSHRPSYRHTHGRPYLLIKYILSIEFSSGPIIPANPFLAPAGGKRHH